MNKTLMFTDFDGTLYNPDVKLFLAWQYNSKSSQLIRATNTKLIITTGRAVWNNFSEFQNKFFGMHGADVVISGAGTYVYTRQKGKLVLDEEWNEKMLASSVTIQKETHLWNKTLIEDAMRSSLSSYKLAITKSSNPYQIVVPVYHMSIDLLFECIEKIQEVLKHGIKILTTEKLYLFNSTQIFSGYMFVIPECAGKDGSAHYIIEKEKTPETDILFFGDAMIDLPMLMLPITSVDKKFSYAINPTPQVAQNIIENTSIQSLRGNPPKLVYTVLKNHFTKTSLSQRKME